MLTNNALVKRRESRDRGAHPCSLLWFTGLSGSGKSTISSVVKSYLIDHGYSVFLLDGDLLRGGLCSDLGFSMEDRLENIRRAAETARLLQNEGFIVLASFISPLQAMRDLAREKSLPNSFFEVYVKAEVRECERRDPKGLYRAARQNALQDFTGITADYEEPQSPDLILDTEKKSLEECVVAVLQLMGLA